MANGSAQPTICAICGCKPTPNKQGTVIGWDWRTRKEGKAILWECVCEECKCNG